MTGNSAVDATELRDQAVELAMSLCRSAPSRQEQIPDRSQLNTLLRCAMSTPSAREVTLFIRYQATRQRRREQKNFLDHVADEIERQPWASDIEAVRFFLGALARAGYVAVQATGQKGGHRG